MMFNFEIIKVNNDLTRKILRIRWNPPISRLQLVPGCEIYDINHDARTISRDRIDMTHPGDSFDSQSLSSRLSSPLTSTRIKTDNVEFWREKV